MIFIQRNVAPLESNKYYGKPDPFITAGLGMFHLGGNCTDYAWCRYREAQQNMKGSDKLPTSAAKRWFEDAKRKGLKTGTKPKLGAVACFTNHVAIVEDIIGNYVIYSASGWTKLKATRYIFKRKKIKIGGSWNGQKLLGYIYPEVDFEEDLPVKGDYKVLSPRYVRKGPGTEFDIKLVKECSKEVREHADEYCTNPKQNAKAQYKSGTIFTNQKTYKAVNGSIWAKTPSGYICLVSSKGTMYCSKV